MKRIKTGDYVEVLGVGNAGIEKGEQGLVVEVEHQDSIELIFPARSDHWANSQYGWLTEAKKLRLLYRPRIK